MRNYLTTTISIFWILATVLVLPTLDVFRIPQGWMRSIAFGLCEKISGFSNFQSDGAGVYFAVFFAIPVALLAGWIFSAYARLIHVFAYRWTVFFLALILLKYGVMKWNFSQFYVPDPNILDTRFGSLTQDMVYWSLVGSSQEYQFFMGFMEVLAATLLLFRKTRFVGLFFASGIFINVVAVNFCFDISVKLLSMICLATSLILLLYYFDLIGMMIQRHFRPLTMPQRTSAALWIIALLVLLSEDVLPVLADASRNGIEHEGSYKCSGSGDRFYLHRSGYVILEKDGKLTGYLLRSNSNSLSTFLHNHHIDTIDWSKHVLKCPSSGKTTSFDAYKRNDPLLKDSFHWTSDEFH